MQAIHECRTNTRMTTRAIRVFVSNSWTARGGCVFGVKIRCRSRKRDLYGFAAIGVNYLTIDPQRLGGWWDAPGQRPQQLGL